LTPGVPMLTAGDEFRRTQKGNNNPYVLDDETSWLAWHLDYEAKALRDYCGALGRLRKRFPALRRETFFDGDDIVWLDVDGHPMQLEDWGAPEQMALSAVLAPVAEDPSTSLCFVLNGDKTEVAFRLPRPRLPNYREGVGSGTGDFDAPWQVLVDTRRHDACADTRAVLQAGATYTVPPRCFALLVATKPLGPEPGMR